MSQVPLQQLSQLSWLERAANNRKAGGSSPSGSIWPSRRALLRTIARFAAQFLPGAGPASTGDPLLLPPPSPLHSPPPSEASARMYVL